MRDKNTIQTELTWEFYQGKERESGERKGVQSGLMGRKGDRKGGGNGETEICKGRKSKM